MRWSLILSTFVTVLSVLSFVSHALPVPSSDSSVELERRGRFKPAPKPAPRKVSSISTNVKVSNKNVKASSQTYRAAGMLHQDAYKVHPTTGQVTRTPLKAGQRLAYGKKTIKIPGMHADHILEAQMVKKHIRDHEAKHGPLPDGLHKEVHRILNGPKNMALIPGGINMGKGQVIRHAMKGNTVKPNAKRDAYIKLSHPTAKKTAKDLDKAFNKHTVRLDQSFTDKLHSTMKAAKIPGLRL